MTKGWYLSVNIETKKDSIEVPIGDENALQVRTDGVYLSGSFWFWEDIVCVLIVPKVET